MSDDLYVSNEQFKYVLCSVADQLLSIGVEVIPVTALKEISLNLEVIETVGMNDD